MQDGAPTEHANGSTLANGALHGADKPIKRVGIIGGGPAGVVQAQQLLEVSKQQDCQYRFLPTIFERRANLGPGIWACDKDAGPCNILFDAGGRAYARWDEKARRWPPGAMYEGLRTNLPVDLMTYRDTPFQEGARAPFPARQEVEDYLRAFSERVLDEGTRSGRCDVRLNTAVQNVVRTNAGSKAGESTWSIESRNLDSGHTTTDSFDFVVLANGRCNVPSLPPIEGLWNFKGRRILHSAWYRTPWEFGNDRTVVVVGNMSSGMDIARELSGWVVRTNDDFEKRDEWIEKVKSGKGPQVINSIEDMTKPPAMDYDPLDPHSPDWSRSIRVVPRIARIEEDGAIALEDGQTLEDVDAIVFATGFYAQYEFIDHRQEPFASEPLVLRPRPVLDPSRGQPAALQSWIQEKQGGEPFQLRQPAASGPSNLDDWYLFYEPDRSLAILGLPTATVPFPMTHVQSHFVASYWGGIASTLPALDRELMQNDPSRWKAVISPEEAKSRGPNEGPMPLIFGSESEPFYIDALLSHISGAGGQPPWEHAVLKVAEPLAATAALAGNAGLQEGHDGDEQRDKSDNNSAVIPPPLSFESKEEAKQYYMNTLKSHLVGGPEEWYDVTAWRRQRRKETRILRRRILGY